MKHNLCSFLIVLYSSICISTSIPSIERRQASSAIANSAFRRRGYQSSAILDGWLYIDGGEFSYASGNDIVYQYSSTLLSIDLSQDWTNSSIGLRSNSKPAGAPNLVEGGLWVDEANKLLYSGFGGRKSNFGNNAKQEYGLWSFAPDGQGGGKWTNLNSTAPTGFQNIRPNCGLVASGNGRGYLLGGIDNGSYISGLVTYDFATKALSNDTVRNTAGDGYRQKGGAHFVPNFGPQGMIVAFGGDQAGSGRIAVDFTIVDVFDPATGNWYQQPTSGNVPGYRKEFCMAGAASNNETYEIFVYSGWGGNLGPAAIPYDEVYVLSLPSFNWFKADYLAENPRHAFSCNHIGGGQIVTVGGVNSTTNGPNDLYKDVFNTQDQFIQGLSIFDLSTMTWSPNYSAAKAEYSPSDQIQQYYATNSRTPEYGSTGLKDLMAVQNFTSTAVKSPGKPSGDGSGSEPSGSSGSSSSSNTGAIVGGVVGGVTALAAVAILVFFIMRRKKQKAAIKNKDGNHVQELPNSYAHAKHEMSGTSNVGKPIANNIVYAKLGPSPQSQSRYEMAGHEDRRHELA